MISTDAEKDFDKVQYPFMRKALQIGHRGNMLLLLLSRFSCVDSAWLHRQQPTRLPHPWESPGMNTGMGCHFLLQCMKVKSESEVAQSQPTLSNPMDCSPQGSSVHGIFQARVLEWGAIAFSHIYSQACLNHWLLATFGMPMTTQPYRATEERKHLPQEVRVRNKELTSSHQPGFCRGQQEVSKRWETAVQRS